MKAIILDDEKHCIDSLSIMLDRYTDVTVVKTFDSSVQAIKEIKEMEADLLFLDIEMPHINGFEFLTVFSSLPWKVIFTTAHNEYAVQAFKFNALDYLMKPILKDELILAVDKVRETLGFKLPSTQIETFIQPFIYQIKKMAIPTLLGLEMIRIDDISHLESQSNYCLIYMIDHKKYMVSKTLKLYEHKLVPYQFIRVHNSFIVNPNHIKRYVKGDGGYLIMDNDVNINVSRTRKDELLRIINQV